MYFNLRTLHQKRWPVVGVIAMIVCVAITFFLSPTFTAQEFLPSPPPDRSLIYRLDEDNKLEPLPFEPGQTPLRPDQVAKSTKISYIELKGEHAETVFATATPQSSFSPTSGPALIRLSWFGSRHAKAIDG